MAKSFAKTLYASKLWKQTRDYIYSRANGICEACKSNAGEEVHHKIFLTADNINDPEIVYGEKNLILVCRPCHSAIHDRAYLLNRTQRIKSKALSSEYEFDAEGNMQKKQGVFIVWGSPVSGKNKYVEEHKGKFDIVSDLDVIRSSLVIAKGKTNIPDVLPFAIEMREALYDAIAKRSHYFEQAWIIAGLQNKTERLALQKRLDAQLIHIDTDRETCKRYAQYDPDRPDKETTYKIIDWYFDHLEL